MELDALWAYLFWTALATLVYTYIGYGLLLWLWRKLFYRPSVPEPILDTEWPQICLLIAAYNEEKVLVEKIENSLQLDYPDEKFQIIVVTDGSTDQTTDILRQYPSIRQEHKDKRAGKQAAVARIIPMIEAEITVFSDANAMLNRTALKEIATTFQRPGTGVVSGEKRVAIRTDAGLQAAGEGMYWKYESLLKAWDADFYSVVGAAGELFAIRTELFEAIAPDSIIEDFVLSMRIAEKGFRIGYSPKAFALENPSASLKDEWLRKTRISAGAFQAIIRLKGLLNIFRHGRLTFQYVSHRVLRWTLAPLSLLVLAYTNTLLLATGQAFYLIVFLGQCLFYALALMGWIIGPRHPILSIPFYFSMMNAAVFAGFWRFLRGKQSVIWKKAERLS